MQNIYFSIIIPTLNEEKYLHKLLKSLSEQTFRDFEVILVDGKSDDNTLGVFRKYERKFPSSQILIANKRNVSFQRNLGGRTARGLYLIFLDADVDIEMDFLKEVYLASIKKKFKLATTYITPDTNTQFDKLMHVFANLGQEISKIINRPFVGGYNTIIDREVFLKLKGFREDVMIAEDHDFAIRANKKNIETVILPEPKVILSLRRYRSEGKLKVIQKHAYAYLYTLIKGPVIDKIFEYEMGGHAHRRKKRKLDLMKVNTYIKIVNNFDRKLNNLLGEI